MKQLIILLFALFSLSAEAQDLPKYRHQIFIGIGTGACRPWFGHEEPGMYDLSKNIYEENSHDSPVLNLGYLYQSTPHWAFGGNLGLVGWHQKMKYIDSGATYDKKGETFLSAMFSTRYYWRTKDVVRTYSGAGLGLSYIWEEKYEPWADTQKVMVAGQLTFLGIEVGKGHLVGFAELGWGIKGWLHGGIGYRF